MLEFELRFDRDAAGLIVGIACKIGPAIEREPVMTAPGCAVIEVERFLGAALREGWAVEGRNPAGLLHAAYRKWAEQHGQAGLSIKGFNHAMHAAGFVQISSNGRKWLLPTGTAERLCPHAPGGAGLQPSGAGSRRPGAGAGVRG